MSKRTSGRRKWGGIRKRGRVYWLWFNVDGERYDETTGQGDELVARALLEERRRAIAAGTWTPATSGPLTVAQYAERWLARRRADGVRNVDDEATWLRTWLVPALGDRALGRVSREDVRDVVATMQRTPSAATGRPYSPRTVRHVYATMRLMFKDAIRDRLIGLTPCDLEVRRGELPTIRDADPRWRSKSIYTREEAEQLISDERIPGDRRVYYALQLLAGLRASEAAGRRWSDVDREAKPLGRLLVWSQAGDGEERGTKTGDVRDVPIHPTLARVLAEWRTHGFPLLFGRRPRPDDLIVPSRRGVDVPRTKKMLVRLKEDLARLELRTEGRGRHAMRATFLTLLEVDGAIMAIASRATHRTPSSPAGAVGGYLRAGWPDLCAEIAKLRLELRGTAHNVITLPRAASGGGGNQGSGDPGFDRDSDCHAEGPATLRSPTLSQSGRLDSKRSAAREHSGTDGTTGTGAREKRRKVATEGTGRKESVTGTVTDRAREIGSRSEPVSEIAERLAAVLERWRHERVTDSARAAESLVSRIEHLVDELRRGRS